MAETWMVLEEVHMPIDFPINSSQSVLVVLPGIFFLICNFNNMTGFKGKTEEHGAKASGTF